MAGSLGHFSVLQSTHSKNSERLYAAKRLPRSRGRATGLVFKHTLFYNDVSLSGFVLKNSGVGVVRAEHNHGSCDSPFVIDDVPHLSDWLPNLSTYPNPLQDNPAYADVTQSFVHPDDVVAKDIVVRLNSPRGLHFRRAGPRQKVYFKPNEVRACIVTWGGLCPGLNTTYAFLLEY